MTRITASLFVVLLAFSSIALCEAPALTYLGPATPESPTTWETKQNPGQSVLPLELTQAYYRYEQKPNGRPLSMPFGQFVDPIGYTKFRYQGDTVRVGFIGCLSGPVKDYSGNMLKGVQLATDELNASGGYFGMPFQIVERDDKAQMGEDGHKMVELIYDEHVLAILGSMGSDTTHVGIRVALKGEVPQLTSISTDPTITQVMIPWAFRILADDWSQGRAMAKLVFQDLGLKRVAILERNSRYGRMGSMEIARVAQRLGLPVEVKLKYDPSADYTAQLKVVKDYGPDAIVIWGLYTDGATITRQARAMGIKAPIFGADGMVSDTYIAQAGADAEGVVVTFPFNDTRDDPATRRFIEAYTARYGARPDSFSAHGYDAMLAMATAIRNAGAKHGKEGGLNRARIRDELSLLKGVAGATGPLEFDHMGNDMRVVDFAVIEGGRFRFLDDARLQALKARLATPVSPSGATPPTPAAIRP